MFITMNLLITFSVYNRIHKSQEISNTALNAFFYLIIQKHSYNITQLLKLIDELRTFFIQMISLGTKLQDLFGKDNKS